MKYFFSFLAGRKAALISIGSLLVLSLCIGLLRQTPPSIWVLLGICTVLSLICLAAVIAKRIARFRFGIRDLGFMLTHIGLFITLFTLGLSQLTIQRLYMSLYEGQTSNRAYNADAYIYQLPFTIGLDSFAIEYYENGNVKSYTSQVTVDRVNKEKIKTQIQVNKPLAISEWMIYQYSCRPAKDGQPPISQLMLVRDIWTWFIYAGLILFMGGSVFLFSKKGGKAC